MVVGMAKYFGIIGFAVITEKDGIYKEEFEEREYYGDVLKNYRRLQSSDKVNDDIIISNEISIVADPYAYQSFHQIRYAEFMGTKWKVTGVEVQDHRLLLSLGGVYNV